MKKKSVFSRVVAWIHLWPSLVAAVLLVFISLTGTIIVFADEILNLSAGEARYVENNGQEKLPFEILLSAYRSTYPKRNDPGYAVIYKEKNRSVRLNSYDKETGLSFVYMDPYTGEVLKEDGTIYFFYIVAHLHGMLLWHGVGEWIVAICTIVFLIELITGLILWWPKKWTKSTRNASFKIKWDAKFKRLNYDLHNVLGFYSLALGIVLSVTGLIIAFKPIADITLNSFGGESERTWEESLPESRPGKTPVNLFGAIDKHFAEQTWAKEAQVRTYFTQKEGYYLFSLSRQVGLKSCDGFFPVFVDKYSGQELIPTKEAKANIKIDNVYWSLHMGTWFGLIGKISTFIAGIIGTTLPITGFLIWWGRRKKKKTGGKTTSTNTPKKKNSRTKVKIPANT
ncbi:sulfite reductase (plasmid) [Fulvitalea axinellae]|uniref:Sulfite reductase n=1 Tax=Fulvitalea axinellae TaxID=1182444 RepID=A0AAU9CWS9_9BACT|nr:sulfite reductase [Fulvitalea axinellae]